LVAKVEFRSSVELVRDEETSGPDVTHMKTNKETAGCE